MQQEVKLRGLDGLKGLFLLVLMGVGIFQGDLLAGQLVPLGLFTVLGYQWAYRLERQQDIPFWRHWQAVWSAWLPVLWLTSITTIGLLALDFSLLNQSKFDLIFSLRTYYFAINSVHDNVGFAFFFAAFTLGGR